MRWDSDDGEFPDDDEMLRWNPGRGKILTDDEKEFEHMLSMS